MAKSDRFRHNALSSIVRLRSPLGWVAIVTWLWSTPVFAQLQEQVSGTECTLLSLFSTSPVSRSKFEPRSARVDAEHGLIVDTNVLRMLVNLRKPAGSAIDPGLKPAIEALQRITGLSEGALRNSSSRLDSFWVTDQVAREFRAGRHQADLRGLRRVQTVVGKNNAAFRSVVDVLKKEAIGGVRGNGDREILAQVFFAKTTRGQPPTFVTRDRAVIAGLCRLAPLTCKTIAAQPAYASNPNGFTVSIRDSLGRLRTIKVLPLPAH